MPGITNIVLLLCFKQQHYTVVKMHRQEGQMRMLQGRVTAAPVGWFLVASYGASKIPIIRANKIKEYRAKTIYWVERKHKGNQDLNYAWCRSRNLFNTRYSAADI